MIDKYRDKLDEKGVSPVIGVILLVAVTVALVALATVIVFDIVSGGVSDTADASVEMEQTDSGVKANIFRNENVEEFILQHEDGTEQRSTKSTGSFTYDNGDGEYTLIAVFGGNEEVIRSKTVVTADASFRLYQTDSGVKADIVRNENVDEFILRHEDGNEKRSNISNGSFTHDNGNGEYTLLIAVVGGNEVVIDSKTVMNGDGSSSSPYEISTASDLQAMQEDLNDNYIVVNDINASCTVNWNNGQGFDPIGEWDVRFAGSLDGQNHTISDLSINRLDDNEVGLFGYISEGGEVKNVGVINVNINGDEKVGGLVGRNYGTVSNSYSTGNVTGKKLVGGLVGENYNGNISNSYSTGNVTGEGEVGEGEVGGLVGQNWGTVSNSYSTGNVTGEKLVGGLVGSSNNNSTISNSYSTGNVTGGYDVGGLVGYDDEGNISNSYSTGNVTGESNVGGLVGDIYKGNISNSYSTGNVTGGIRVGGLVGENSGTTVSNSYSTGNVSGDNRVGGLVGDNSGTVSNSYSTGNVIGESFDVGGLVGDNEGTVSNSNGLTTSEMQGSSASSSMSGFDFTDTWSTVEGDYPELQWQE